MIVPASVRRRFERDEIALEAVSQKVWETVSRFCVERGFAVTGRQKGFQSLAEKLETGRYYRWSELDDLYACKIIVPTLLDEPGTLAFLDRVFQQVRVIRRGSTKKRPDVFRFDATRFVGRLRASGDPARAAECAIQFEVQVVTAFEHAWSTTTHALAYKSGDLNWKTRRIAAQLRASVEQLDMIVLGAGESASYLEESPCPELDDQKVILEGFQSLVAEGVIPEELAPDKWSRFAENVHSLLNDQRRARTSVGPREVLQACRAAAEEYTPATFPRLVSLHQFVLGTLIEAAIIELPITQFTPLLTEEMRHIFPGLESVPGGFDLET